jgi:hypothetical protein
MGIRAHPGLTNGKTSKGHLGTQSHGCAGQTVRPSLHSISQTSAGKLSILNLVSLLSDVRHQRDHVKPSPRSHRRSLAPGGERWWRRGVAGIPLVDLSEPLSRDICSDPGLITATARENRPGDAGELVGERDRQHVAVESLRCPLDPGPQTRHCRPRPPH